MMLQFLTLLFSLENATHDSKSCTISAPSKFVNRISTWMSRDTRHNEKNEVNGESLEED